MSVIHQLERVNLGSLMTIFLHATTLSSTFYKIDSLDFQKAIHDPKQRRVRGESSCLFIYLNKHQTAYLFTNHSRMKLGCRKAVRFVLTLKQHQQQELLFILMFRAKTNFPPGSPVPSYRWEMNPTSYFCSLTISKMHHKHRDHITVYFININKDRKTLLVIKRLPRL